MITIEEHRLTVCLMLSFTQERDMTILDPLGSLNNILMLMRKRRVSTDQNTRWYSLVWPSIQFALSGSGMGFCKSLHDNSDISIHNDVRLCPLFMVTRTTLAPPPSRSPRVVPLLVAPYCWVWRGCLCCWWTAGKQRGWVELWEEEKRRKDQI